MQTLVLFLLCFSAFREFQSPFYKNTFILTFIMETFYFIFVWRGLKSINFFKNAFFLPPSNKLAIENNLLMQEDFIWQEIWRTTVHLFKVRWNDHVAFSELFSSDTSLWNQCKYIAFNMLSCRILIISYKMLIITGIFNEKINELIKYALFILPTKTSFFISSARKIERVQECKMKLFE